MKREWKPGDVAIARFPIWGVGGRDTTFESLRVIRWADGWARADNPDDYVDDDNGVVEVTEIRPLVVLDPESDDDVGSVVDAYVKASHGNSKRGPVLVMQAALRSLVASPRPEEPMGLGAVVEDAEGAVWTRVATHAAAPWYSVGASGAATNARSASWSRIDVVRKLSDGWEGE